MELLQYQANTLVEPRHSRVLSSYVTPGWLGVLDVVGQLHLFPLIINRIPIRYPTHAGFAIAELLAEAAVLRVRVSASVRIVESDVQEKRPNTKNKKRRELIVNCRSDDSIIKLFARICHARTNSLAAVGREKLANEELDAGDVTADLEDGFVLLCVGEIERICIARTDVFLADYTC